MTTSSSERLKPNAAQRIMLSVLEKARAQVDLAARAPLARDRTRARRKLERAIAALTDKTQ